MACYDVSLNEKYEGPKLEYRLLPTFGPSIFIRQLWCSLMRGHSESKPRMNLEKSIPPNAIVLR